MPAAKPPVFTLVPRPLSLALSPQDGERTLGYSNAQGQTIALTFPPAAVAMTTTVWLTPTVVAGTAGLGFAGQAFNLSWPALQTPMTLTMTYTDSDLAVIADPSLLALYRYSEDEAPTPPSCQGTVVAHDPERQTLLAFLCEPGRYALLGPTNSIWLPVVSR
jgi:hypothetical protein